MSKASFLSRSGTEVSPLTNVEEGVSYSWNWYAQGYHEEGIVLQANGVDHFQFTFAGNCKVDIKLTEENKQVFVELTHSEIPIDDSSKRNIRIGCAEGWSFYLLNLKSILEGGIDLRNKDSTLVGVINN